MRLRDLVKAAVGADKTLETLTALAAKYRAKLPLKKKRKGKRPGYHP